MPAGGLTVGPGPGPESAWVAVRLGASRQDATAGRRVSQTAWMVYGPQGTWIEHLEDGPWRVEEILAPFGGWQGTYLNWRKAAGQRTWSITWLTPAGAIGCRCLAVMCRSATSAMWSRCWLVRSWPAMWSIRTARQSGLKGVGTGAVRGPPWTRLAAHRPGRPGALVASRTPAPCPGPVGAPARRRALVSRASPVRRPAGCVGHPVAARAFALGAAAGVLIASRYEPPRSPASRGNDWRLEQAAEQGGCGPVRPKGSCCAAPTTS
jgi:hypothetical protein